MIMAVCLSEMRIRKMLVHKIVNKLNHENKSHAADVSSDTNQGFIRYKPTFIHSFITTQTKD